MCCLSEIITHGSSKQSISAFGDKQVVEKAMLNIPVLKNYLVM